MSEIREEFAFMSLFWRIIFIKYIHKKFYEINTIIFNKARDKFINIIFFLNLYNIYIWIIKTFELFKYLFLYFSFAVDILNKF